MICVCGRYYVDDETAREIEKIVRNLDRKLKMQWTGDVFPSQSATVITEKASHLTAEQMQWGLSRVRERQATDQCKGRECIGTSNISG